VVISTTAVARINLTYLNDPHRERNRRRSIQVRSLKWSCDLGAGLLLAVAR
jgi:hypothetical protein